MYISYANSNYNNLIKQTENDKQFEYAHVYSLYLIRSSQYWKRILFLMQLT